MSDKILLVDDEPNVLELMQRQLRNRFDIKTAQSGEEALEVLRTCGPFAVIVSDMKMPGIDGVQLLSRVKDRCPDTVRIILTGDADQETAIEAVNTGQIFRFLSKPCSTATLATALALAARHYRLVIAEKGLLNETLMGSMKVLSEILSQSNATIFGAGARIKKLVGRLCEQEQYTSYGWQYQIAAVMSQIGCITLPPDILHKLYAGVDLNPEEREMYEHHPDVGRRLFAHILRMELIAGMVGMQLSTMDEYEEEPISLDDAVTCRGAQMLKVAIDYDILSYQGLSHHDILQRMKKTSGFYNPEILNVLKGLKIEKDQGKVVNLKIKDIQTGMIAEEDVFANNGVLVIPKGQVVTWQILQGLHNFSKQVGIKEPICLRKSVNEEG